MPSILTRDELYGWLHERLLGAARLLSVFERDSLIQAAAAGAAVAARRASSARTSRDEGAGETHREPVTGDIEAAGEVVSPELPFRLRPGLVAEMLRFYDQLRRQSQRLERFNELIEETLGGATDDRGADRQLAQTRFLNETFREYERRAAASGAWDEHMLRERLISQRIEATPSRIVVTIADWIAEPDGLFIADFDLLARMPDLPELDLVCTEQVLGSGFHERLHGWWPGLEEVNGRDLLDGAVRDRPRLEAPKDVEQLWFTTRDREEELVLVAHRIDAARRSVPTGEAAAPPAKTAVVFKRPLPYLYLAPATLGAAGIQYEAADALPLAGEPVVATVDLALDAVESAFSRESLVALLRSPHLAIDGDGTGPPVTPDALHTFDLSLRERGYLGDLERLELLATEWADLATRPLVDAALALARELAPLRERTAASVQLARVERFLRTRMRPLQPEDPFASREARGRSAMFTLLETLAEAHRSHHDPEWALDDLASSVRRWIEEHTFADESAGGGVQLLDDRAARYGSFDDITIVGLVEAEWPEPHARNIFYPAGLLKALGWFSEQTRRRAADARFIDLLGAADRRVAVSTITLDDDAIVMRSMQLDEIPRARLAVTPTADRSAPIIAYDALALDPVVPVVIDALPQAMREWATRRVRRTRPDEPAYHGLVGGLPERAWSVSALETYLACPFKFYAQHVLRLTDEPDDSDAMNPRQQGEFIHEVFEVFFTQWGALGYGAITPELLDEARRLFADVVDAQIQALPEAEAGLERTRLLGSSAAAGLGEAVLRMEAERPIPVVERLLEQRLDGAVALRTATGERVIQLKGKADRIDLLADGSFRLIDYKLGWPPQRARALQLPIYALAAQQRLHERDGRSWTLGEAAYLAFKGPKRVVPLFGPQNDPQKTLADAQQRVADVVDAIARGEFPPRPEDVFLCDSCSFAAVCRKDYVDEAPVR
jgi:RecB family exonuclease